MPIQGLNNTAADVSIREREVTSTQRVPSEQRIYQDIRYESRVQTQDVSLNTQTDPAESGDIPPPMSEGGDGAARHDWLVDRVYSLQAVIDLGQERRDALVELTQRGTPEQRTAAREVLRQLNLVQRELDRDQRELDWLEQMDEQGRFRYEVTPVGTQDEIIGSEPTWPTPADTATTLSGGRGTATGTGDVILNNVSGDVSMRKSGSTLFIGDYEIQNAFDEEGHMTRRVYLRGGEVNYPPYFSGMNESHTAIQRDDHGNIVGGINYSARNTSATRTPTSPFAADSAWRIDASRSTNEEQVYSIGSRAMGTNVQFQAPASYQGQPVRAVEVVEDQQHPGDILVKLRSSPQGRVLVTYRLVNAKASVENYTLKFKGAENGQYWDAHTLNLDWEGGDGGHNMIRFLGGNIHGGDAGDYIKQEGNGRANIIGGRGNDFIVSGNAHDGEVNVNAGDGNDFIYGGSNVSGGRNKHLNGGAGNDVIIVDSNADDTHTFVDGGEGGIDYSNSINNNTSNIERNGLQRLNQRLNDWENNADNQRNYRDSANADMRAFYRTQISNMENAIESGAETIMNGALSIFTSKETEFASFFTGATVTFSAPNTSWQSVGLGAGGNTGNGGTPNNGAGS